MVRTQIQLPQTKYQQLREASHRLNRSMAECIREGIDLFLGQAGGSDDLSDVAGKFRPLPPREDDSHDARWAKAIADSKRKGRS
jgi:hypothetical protein